MKRLLWMLPLLAIALGAFTSFLFARATSDSLDRLGQADSPALSRVQALVFDLTSVADGFKSAVAAADKAALDAVGERARQLRTDLQRYAQVPGHAGDAARLGKAFDTYYDASRRVASIMLDGQAGDVGDAAQAMQAALATLQQDLTGQQAAAQQALDAHIADTQALVRRGFAASVAASLLMLALSIGVSWWSVRGLMRQLGGRPDEATGIVQRIAGGDLSVPVVLNGPDRSSLLHAMHGMQGWLCEVIGEVREAVQRVHLAADAIGQGNHTLAERSGRQAESLQASAASIDELSAAVRSNADSAEQARVLAQRASEEADEGGRAVAEAVAAMGEISERARKIVEITALIDGIAFQTNILALNAAVEAARAGEQGRGFTVVAGEVRTLAQRAGVAAKEIKALIDDSAERIEAGARHVNEAGEVMHHLVDSVKQVGEHIAQITTASAEQRQGIEHVNVMVTELSGHTQDNHRLVAQAGEASRTLQQVAAQLDVAIGRFRLDGTAPAGRELPLLTDAV
jgi:methyl-accepting chemotaxis protein